MVAASCGRDKEEIALAAARASSAPRPAEKIVVRIRVGSDLMAASDDPLFLRLGGPAGREFRLLLGKEVQVVKVVNAVAESGKAQGREHFIGAGVDNHGPSAA